MVGIEIVSGGGDECVVGVIVVVIVVAWLCKLLEMKLWVVRCSSMYAWWCRGACLHGSWWWCDDGCYGCS